MSTSLGKRKEREDASEGAFHGSTLFVSNLPYTATSTDLKTLFSDIAPVRTAFVVTEQGSGVSKGVGYVSFAIREDATMAMEKISTEGIELNGRSLRVQWPVSKGKDDELDKKPKEKPAKMPSRPAQPAGPRDPLAIRTVVIGGLPSSIDSKAIWKKVRKLEGTEKVDWPVTSEAGSEDRSVAHVLFASPAAANDAVNKLHAHVFKGSLLSATLKKRLDGLAKAPKKAQPATAAAPSKPGVTPSRSSRLIVRNLPFNITEQDLRAIFLPYGPIYSVDIPEKKDTPEDEGDGGEEKKAEKRKPRRRGFAFVWMLSRKDAEKALEGCNGMTVQAGMAEKIVSDKQKRKKQKREEKKLSQLKQATEGDAAEESGEEGRAEERTDAQRVIAVDWALSKDKWEKEKAKIEEELAKEEDVEMPDVKSEDGGAAEDESDDEHIGVHGDGESDVSDSDSAPDESDDEDSEDEDETPAKPTLPPPETGTTLFVRNVPFEATDDELRTLFRAFGPLRYARITLDPETGRSRGTGFVCFWNKEHADKAVEQSQILRAETTGGETVQPKKNPFKLPSLLTPDPSASIAQNLVLHGRTLDVVRAVTRDEAGKLKEAGERQREKADKRNLYLLREGIVLPNSPAAELLPPAEVEKRTQSFNSRRALLRSNPSLYVSRTRLSVRQLPIHVTERMLKRLAIHAMRAFETEVKKGTRQGLTEDELAEPETTDAQEPVKEEPDADEQHKKGKRPSKGRNTGVKQSKIVRQHERVDPVIGKGRSKGYGFLEMTSHAEALRVLRWANNNPSANALFEEWWKTELQDLLKIEKKKEKKDEARIMRIKEELERGAPAKTRGTLIVEFSIENVQVVHRRAEKQQASGEDKKRSRTAAPIKTEETDSSPRKKRRVSTGSPEKHAGKDKSVDTSPGDVKENPGQNIGSLIGRKRKERRKKKGGA
ncbi:RNA-binding domain-containing protein [Obba rivulosa]|uniref:RNA-binding domain-containing protein n=1 Tax=Obba rivulosa TaxID=1052685 RepID=A0A8E2ASL1_9APHY|nr:RNA-binding domain-containing protein [Obba rivulosa]